MDKLTAMIVSLTGCEPEQVQPSTTWAQLHMEPMDVATLLGKVGTAYKVTFTVADMAGFATVGDLSTWLEAP